MYFSMYNYSPPDTRRGPLTCFFNALRGVELGAGAALAELAA